MIVIQAIGGLGNQMFQYAIGRAISYKLNTTLRIDTRAFNDYDLHNGFELNGVFKKNIQIANQATVDLMLGWQSSKLAQRMLARSKLARMRRKELIVEPHFQYWAGVNSLPSNCYLIGYWQSEKYFKEIEQTIRADFQFRPAMNQQNTDLAVEISNLNAVSLHVRRGDYVSNPATKATHGLCTLEYYESAIEFVASKVKNPQFYVFSDDPQWVKNHLEIQFPCSYVEHNQGEESYNDMRLMSLCKHNIIANSSFSWWGAWLNANPDKVVVAPRKWFASDKNTSDLLPSSWVVL